MLPRHTMGRLVGLLGCVVACDAAGSSSSSDSTTYSPPPPNASPPPTTTSSATSPPPAASSVSTPFVFADGEGNTGLWSAAPNYVSKYEQPRGCPVGGFVSFHWDADTSNHDVVQMKSREHYESCDFEGSTTLAGTGSGGNQSYYYACSTAGERAYLSCSVGDHCQRGQKLEVAVSSTESVKDSSGEMLLHSRSLAQVMTLLGSPTMDRGYQTDSQAEHTLEMIWCLETHCPDSAKDWQADATEASCKADVYNLGGFVSRKKPTPDKAAARLYYNQALGFDSKHCPTLEYLTELNLNTNNASGAATTAERLCNACGAESTYAALALAAFADAGVSPPAACTGGGASPAVLAAAIGGGVALLLLVLLAVRKLAGRRAATARSTVAGKAVGKTAVSGGATSGGLDVGLTPPTPSLPPSPPGSGRHGNRVGPWTV